MPEGVDITLATGIYVTFGRMDGSLIMTKTDDDLEISNNSVEVYLTQEETLSFPNGQIQVQLNWLYPEGGKVKRACSQIMTISARKNLIDEVLSHG
jgi:hypothetical protein